MNHTATSMPAALNPQRQALPPGEATIRQSLVDNIREYIESSIEPLSDADLMGILEMILDHALRAINAADGSVLVRDEHTGELVFALVQGDVPDRDLLWRRLPPGKGIASWVAKNGATALVNDAGADNRFYAGLDRELKFSTHSILAAPIIAGKEVLGVIEVLNKRDGMLFEEDDRVRLSGLCQVAGDLLFSLIHPTE